MKEEVCCVLAVDPGLVKCGAAVVDKTLRVLWHGVVPRINLEQSLRPVIATHAVTVVVIGDGTASVIVIKDLRKSFEHITITTVPERLSTEEARQRYWRENPPSGWRKWVPQGLLFPPVPVDDWAAVILAERYFCKKNN